MGKLTPKQKRFCEEYMKDMNATQAAIRSGYSEKTAKVIAAQNLSKLNVQEYIQELKNEVAERSKITVDEIVKDLTDIAQDVLSEKPHRLKAYEMLMKHLGGFDADNKLSIDAEPTQMLWGTNAHLPEENEDDAE